jgi:hypothetical protein
MNRISASGYVLSVNVSKYPASCHIESIATAQALQPIATEQALQPIVKHCLLTSTSISSFLALDGHEYFPSRSLPFNHVKYNQTAGYTGQKFILEAMEQRKYSLLPEINLIYCVFKAVTYPEKRQVLSAHLPNFQQAISTAALALNGCYKQLNY